MILFTENCCPCNCQPRIIASYVTNGRDPNRTVWQVGQYIDSGYPCGFWRIYERSYNRQYDSGSIDKNGRLVGLPDEFYSNYAYEGYMELQQGCCPPDMACCNEWDAVWPS